MELGKEIFEAGSQMAIKQGASASTRFQVNLSNNTKIFPNEARSY